MKLFKLALAAIVAVALVSCGGNTKEPSGGGNGNNPPEEVGLGKLSPQAAMEEDVVGHDKTFSVICGGTPGVKMQTGTWATVKEVKSVSGNSWQITVSLEFNNTEEEREDKLIVTYGSSSTQATIRQKPLSSLVENVQEIVIEEMTPGKITVNFPVDWEITLTDTKAVDEWLSIEPTSGTANNAVTLTFSPKTLNLSADSRKAYGKIDLGGGTVYLDVSQTSCLPSSDFLADDAVYGLYNAYPDGSGLIYDELAHQVNILKSSALRSFRLVDPTRNKFIEFAGLPKTFAEGDAVSFTFNNHWDKNIGSDAETIAWVGKVSGGKVWLVDNEKRGYIIAE